MTQWGLLFIIKRVLPVFLCFNLYILLEQWVMSPNSINFTSKLKLNHYGI